MTTQPLGVMFGMYFAFFRGVAAFLADMGCDLANHLKFIQIVYIRPVWPDYCLNIQAELVQVIRKHVL